MKIELKNVKISKFASHETYCYQATVYVNGERAFIAENDGQGGCDLYTPINADLYKQAQTYAKSLPNEPEFNLPMNLELLIGELLNKYENDKYFAKILKTHTLFSIPGVTKEGEYKSIKAKGQKVIDYIMKKYPTAQIFKLEN